VLRHASAYGGVGNGGVGGGGGGGAVAAAAAAGGQGKGRQPANATQKARELLQVAYCWKASLLHCCSVSWFLLGVA